MSVFKSMLHYDGENIYAEELYTDIENFIEKQKHELNVERLGRKHPLQHILNSTSGNYVSPTAMKGFMACPGNYLYQKLVPRDSGTATSLGTTFHSIMQYWYDSEDRSRKNLQKIKEEFIEKDGQQEWAATIDKYVNCYLTADDYLGGRMNHQKLKCSNELFLKPNIQPLGVNIGVPVYTLIDRLDIREDGIYLIDYKTGFGDPSDYMLGHNGYLPQMIFYKWVVEAEYGEPVKEAMLCLPGAYTDKYVKMNVASLVEQSKVIDDIFDFLDKAAETRKTKVFTTSRMRYCRSCKFKEFCSIYNKEIIKNEDFKIQEDIPVEIDVLDRVYTEDDD